MPVESATWSHSGHPCWHYQCHGKTALIASFILKTCMCIFLLGRQNHVSCPFLHTGYSKDIQLGWNNQIHILFNKFIIDLFQDQEIIELQLISRNIEKWGWGLSANVCMSQHTSVALQWGFQTLNSAFQFIYVWCCQECLQLFF